MPDDLSCSAWLVQGLAVILVGLFGVNSFPWLGIILLVLIPGFAFCLTRPIGLSIDREFGANWNPGVDVRCFG